MQKLILFILLINFHHNGQSQDVKLNREPILIEWVGATDKPVPKIVICSKCEDLTIMLDLHQYQIKESILNNINNHFKPEIKINEMKIYENNKDVYFYYLQEIILILENNNENSNLVNDIKLFIERLDY